jgi:hypothetical protein
MINARNVFLVIAMSGVCWNEHRIVKLERDLEAYKQDYEQNVAIFKRQHEEEWRKILACDRVKSLEAGSGLGTNDSLYPHWKEVCDRKGVGQ